MLVEWESASVCALLSKGRGRNRFGFKRLAMDPPLASSTRPLMRPAIYAIAGRLLTSKPNIHIRDTFELFMANPSLTSG
jgi:hypothetical protein